MVALSKPVDPDAGRDRRRKTWHKRSYDRGACGRRRACRWEPGFHRGHIHPYVASGRRHYSYCARDFYDRGRSRENVWDTERGACLGALLPYWRLRLRPVQRVRETLQDMGSAWLGSALTNHTRERNRFLGNRFNRHRWRWNGLFVRDHPPPATLRT